MKGLVIAALAVPLLAGPSSAQRRTSSIELWGGASNGSPQWGLLGEAPGVSLGLVGLRWSRTSRGADEGALPAFEWTVDLFPLARMSPPLKSLRGTGVPCPASLCVLAPEQSGGFPPGSPYGVGFAPIGFVKRFRTSSPVSPFFGLSGGALLFNERVPTTKAARFNFTAAGELGIRFGPPDQSGITVAYRFHHLSNAGTAGENPGLASQLITVGLHRPWRGTTRARPRG